MGVVWALVRVRTRRAWRTTLLLALLTGIVGGLAMAAAAGARRMDTAFARMSEATRAHDVLVNPDQGIDSALAEADVADLPSVETVGRAAGMVAVPVDESGLPDIERLGDGITFGVSDEHILRDVFRPLLVDGRLPDQDDPTELLIQEDTLTAVGRDVGDTVEMAVPTFEEIVAWEDSGADGPIPGERIQFTIVGAGRWTNEIVVDEEANLNAVWLTRAFYEQHREGEVYFGLFIRLRPGASEDDLRADIQAVAPDEPIEFQSHATITNGVERAVRPQVIAVAAFALLVALTGLLLVGQAVGRLLRADDPDLPALRAAGVTRRQLVTVALLRALAIGVLGALVAVVLAVALSPIFPVGTARPAEPDPGIAANLALLGVGGGAIVALLLAWVIGPAWAASSLTKALPAEGTSRRTSSIARAARRAGASVPAVAGIRMAFERGRGATATPVWSTLAGLVVAVGALVASIVFASNLQRMIDEPRLWGWSWDLMVGFDAETERDDLMPVVEHPDVESASLLTADRIVLDGESLPAIGLQPLEGEVLPTIAEGRVPEEGEVALGSRTLDRLDVRIGEEVTARSPSGEERELAVVGQAVFPGLGTYPGGDRTELGAGVLATVPTLDGLGEGFGFANLVIDVRPGVDPASIGPGLLERLPGPNDVDLVAESVPQRPGDVDSLADVTWVPALLAGILAFMAVVALAHALVSSVRRRGKEIAVSKALGFSRGQVGATVRWQAMLTTLTATLLGVPLGVIVGRWAWIATADALGISPELQVPWLAVLLVVPAALLVANLLAWLPARRAARTPAAEVLRSE